MDGKEIEIKIQIDENNYYRILNLLKNDATFRKEKHQVDVYYSPEDESFYNSGDRCLRVRLEDKNTILSYKRIFDENTSKQFIEEYETHVESFEMIDSILMALNYQKELIIDKHRIEYWLDSGFLIALDKVADLGFFIEIENRNEKDTLEIRNRQLIEIVQQINIDISMRNTEGYSNMMYKKIKESDE